MIKTYQKPNAEVIEFELEEIIMDDYLDPSMNYDEDMPDGWE